MKEIKIIVDVEYEDAYRELLDYLKANGVLEDVTYKRGITRIHGLHPEVGELITIKYKEVK